MIDTILAAVPVYGLWVVTAATFLSCLAVPIPSSLVMLTAGAFVASGDLPLAATVALAWTGAVAGDQAGFWLARSAAQRIGARSGRAAEVRAKATALLARWGGWGVFLSRWLLSPLGPSVNLVAGAARMRWSSFALWGAAGEAVWVALYVGLGATLSGSLVAAAEIAGNVSGLLAAGAVTAGLGMWLRAAHRADRRLSRRRVSRTLGP